MFSFSHLVLLACLVHCSAASLSWKTYFLSCLPSLIFYPSDRSSHPSQYHDNHLSFVVPMHTDTYQRTEPILSFSLSPLIPSPPLTPRRCLGLYLVRPSPSHPPCSYLLQSFPFIICQSPLYLSVRACFAARLVLSP